jgi:hypothetical protein
VALVIATGVMLAVAMLPPAIALATGLATVPAEAIPADGTLAGSPAKLKSGGGEDSIISSGSIVNAGAMICSPGCVETLLVGRAGLSGPRTWPL